MSSKMHFNIGRSGLTGLLKDGYKHMSGTDEAVVKNIEAAVALANITRTSLGPGGMNKLVINHLERVFITSDAATIVGELEIAHPAAKMVTMAAKQQESEIGDASNFVVTFAGELLHQAKELLRMGVHTSDIVVGYRTAADTAMALMDKELCCFDVSDPRDVESMSLALRSVIAAKQYGYEHLLAPLIAQACVAVMPAMKDSTPSINLDSIRVSKMIGGTVGDSCVVKGLVVQRDTEGSVKHAPTAKIAVFGCGIEAGATETKGTVVLNTADELRNFTKSEEKAIEEAVAGIAAAGASVVVAGGSISEIAQHYLNKYNLLTIKIISKWELRRLCRTVNATALARLQTPTEDEMGFASQVSVQELSGRRVTVFEQANDEDTGIATIVLRGSSMQILDDLERAVNDGAAVAKQLCRDGRCLPGAGATEMALALRLKALAASTPGLDQYAIDKFADAMEVVPRTLAENSGQNATEVISALYAAHDSGKSGMGVDVSGAGTTKDAVEAKVFDALKSKYSALQLAADAAITVLRVDTIIMAKQAGGPKGPPQQPGGAPRSATSDYL